MKTQNKLILDIPDPCSENWAEMPIMERGRFCANCRKVVTDITALNDAQIIQFFNQYPYTHCVQALHSQLNRPIALPAQAPTRFYRIAIARGLTIVMASTANTNARPKAPLVEQNEWMYISEDSTTQMNIDSDTVRIKGVVLLDSQKKDLGVGAIVKVYEGGAYKSGTITEDDGSFEISTSRKAVINNAISIEVVMISSETQRIHLDSSSIDTPLNIILKAGKVQLKGEIIIKKSPRRLHDKPGQTTYDEDDLKRAGF